MNIMHNHTNYNSKNNDNYLFLIIIIIFIIIWIIKYLCSQIIKLRQNVSVYDVLDNDSISSSESENAVSTTNEIEPLQKVTINSIQECSICLGKIKNKYCITNCNHIYHTICLQRWKYSNDEFICPLCRVEITNIKYFN